MTSPLQLATTASFNTALLFRLTDHMTENEQFDQFVRAQYEQGMGRDPQGNICLVNQVHILGLAYFSLVWLWESCARDGCRNSIVDNEEVIAITQGIQQVAGPRDITNASETLRLLRNALSHGRVQVQPQQFSFSDKGRTETEWTTLEASQEVIGNLCMAVIEAQKLSG